jgi:hypothetical protein
LQTIDVVTNNVTTQRGGKPRGQAACVRHDMSPDKKRARGNGVTPPLPPGKSDEQDDI